ncbi:MAG: transglutaminase domain-containing protein [Planctomycetota bacterium]|nr:transglutaminase domain-containing protein [Planctomycetota bacterium]
MATRLAKAKFKDNYWRIYHGRDEVMLKSLEELPGDAAGAKIVLQSSREGFSHFLYSIDDAPFDKSADGCIEVRFEKGGTSDQHVTVVVKAVTADGTETKPYTLKFGYYSSEFYKASGLMSYPNILIMDSSPILNFHIGGVEDWDLAEPAPEELEFAAKKWKPLIEGAKTGYEKAKLLIKSLMDDLWPHNGNPSDEQEASKPFVQYERMVSGKDKGWCTNFATIFVHACNCLGIPARLVGMGQIHSLTDKCRIQRGGCHSTCEIFDDKSNQWIWMDISFYALGAYLGKEGPLNMAEFHFFLNQPARRKRLKLHIYNLDDKSDKILPLEKCPKTTFDYWEGWDREFHYGKPNVDK